MGVTEIVYGIIDAGAWFFGKRIRIEGVSRGHERLLSPITHYTTVRQFKRMILNMNLTVGMVERFRVGVDITPMSTNGIFYLIDIDGVTEWYLANGWVVKYDES